MFGLKGRQFFFLFLLALVIYVGALIIPVEFRAYQFSDSVHSAMQFAASSRKTPEKVRTEILDEARRSDIPIGLRDIVITRRGPSFSVNIQYQIPVDFHIYELIRTYHVTGSGEIFDK